MGVDLAEALATTVIGEYDGCAIISTGIEIPGAAGGLRDPLKVAPFTGHKGQKVFVLLETTVDKIRFDPLKDTEAWRQVSILKTDIATIVDEGFAKSHLDAQREAIRLAEEEAAGIQRLGLSDKADDGEPRLGILHGDGDGDGEGNGEQE